MPREWHRFLRRKLRSKYGKYVGTKAVAQCAHVGIIGVRETMEQVDIMSRVQQAYPKVFSSPPNGTTAMSAFREGKIISPLGIEGLHSIGNSLAHLRIFYELGVSYATLTHNCHNRYADAAILELPGGGIKKSDPL